MTDTLIGATNNCTVSSGSLGVIADDSGPSCMDVTQSSGENSGFRHLCGHYRQSGCNNTGVLRS